MNSKYIFLASWLFASGFLSVGAESAVAKTCKLSDIVSNYQTGLQHFKAKNYNRALVRWVPLAEAGLGPAQRQIAKMYAAGIGLEKSSIKAALWSELSFRSGDREGRRLSANLRIKVKPEERQPLKAQLGAWKARDITCEKGRAKDSA